MIYLKCAACGRNRLDRSDLSNCPDDNSPMYEVVSDLYKPLECFDCGQAFPCGHIKETK
jgi:hypothetical protein